MRRVWALAPLVFFGCDTKPSGEAGTRAYPVPEVVPTGDTIAVIGPVTMTTGEIEERLRGQNPLVKARLQNPDELARFVEGEVRTEFLAQVGWERGLFDDPEVQRTLRQAVVRKLMVDLMEDIDKDIEISDAEIVKLYSDRQDTYYRPERVRVAQVSLPVRNESEKKKALDRMQSLAKQVDMQQRKGRPNAFDEVARQITGETGATRDSVDLGFVSKDELAESYGHQVAAHVFDEMEVGDLHVAALDSQVVFLSKTGRRGEVRRSLETVRPSLISQLRAEKRTAAVEERIAKLATERNVSLQLSNLDKIDYGNIPTPANAEPAAEAPVEK
ncbi:MAG: hypothetical protein HC923_11335 [Myxococcales bacterium]|nr:hypothetical protein [Myxococcales bacterium]